MEGEGKLITAVLRIILGHCGVRARLKRFSIVDRIMCGCLEDHETVDHIIWKFSRFSSERACLIQRLLPSGVHEAFPIRDLCAQLNWKAPRECFMFFVECSVMLMPVKALVCRYSDPTMALWPRTIPCID
jgi:hypothetical protein